jgi:hypothetical protein
MQRRAGRDTPSLLQFPIDAPFAYATGLITGAMVPPAARPRAGSFGRVRRGNQGEVVAATAGAGAGVLAAGALACT